MSRVAIQGDASGTGTFTIAAPNSNSSPTLTLPTTTGTILTTASTTGISGSAISTGTVAEAYGGTGTSTGYYGFKNRIINGDMRIDQRNAGASVTPTNTSVYPVDRTMVRLASGSGHSAQRSTTAPAGFSNSLAVTIGTGASPGATDSNYILQYIEGFNTADLSFGSASASTITISFWVRSSLTGTFSGSILNSAFTRSYPFTYVISSANTWEQKSVTISGDTTGTWLTDNGIGISLMVDLGSGSTYQGTAGSWAAVRYQAATSATKLVATSGATFYITGVQLEKGSAATSFDYRPYGTELALCQRYYFKTQATVLNARFGVGQCTSTTQAEVLIQFLVQMRTAPTALEQSGTASHYKLSSSSGSGIVCSSVPAFNIASVYSASTNFTVASGLTAGNATFGFNDSLVAYLAWSAEL